MHNITRLKNYPYAAYMQNEDEMLTFIVFQDAFRSLTRRQKIVLGLRLLEYTQSSIAKIIGVSRTSISSIEKKAISQVKEVMEEVSPDVQSAQMSELR